MKRLEHLVANLDQQIEYLDSTLGQRLLHEVQRRKSAADGINRNNLHAAGTKQSSFVHNVDQLSSDIQVVRFSDPVLYSTEELKLIPSEELEAIWQSVVQRP